MKLSSFQKPSRYINNEINSIHKKAAVRVALAFPDLYEVGMSHLGLRILYKIINDLPFASAERVFSPWFDLEAEMRAKKIPLSSLESNSPLKDFDILGFSLQHELSYTTVLNMLYLGNIPLHSEERTRQGSTNRYPIVIAGGPCTVNPAPMSPFIDAFLIGDGEEAIEEILHTYYRWKKDGDGKRDSILLALSEIEGMYVPSIYDNPVNPPISPLTKGGVRGVKGAEGGFTIKRRIIESLDDAPYPDNPVLPYTSIVHDRINIEVSRGCSRGCRFCQAGIIYRPVRERSPARALEIAENSLKYTGYGEVAFTSLSAGDYSCLLQLLKEFNSRFSKNKVAISLPSLRVASVNHSLLKEIRTVRKTGFTIAPEAGSERLRRVINKDFSEEDYERALRTLFEEGWLNLKLYFMIGLPTETEEDVEKIPLMALRALRIAKEYSGRFVNINIGVSPFVPKPHTPFQWYGQRPFDDLKRNKDYLRDVLPRKGFKIKGHDLEMSLLEAAFSRGNRSLATLIEAAWYLGCRLDGWTEAFDFEKWKRAMDLTGIDVMSFAQREYKEPDTLPWENIDVGVRKEFLWREYQQALSGNITSDCRKVCHNCGLECKDSDKLQVTLPLFSKRGHGGICRRFKPVRIRVEFSKTGIMKYLSHLELITLMHRAMRRAEFPLEYSKGFHPSPRISFGPPLRVGIEGLSEYFDMEVVPPFDIVLNRRKLNNLLPGGIYIKNMVFIPAKTKSLDSFIRRYEYYIKCRDLEQMHRFLSEKEINVQRERQIINLRSMVEQVTQVDEETINLIVIDYDNAKVRLGELLLKIFNFPLKDLQITRVALYGWNGGWVKPLERSSECTMKS
ncbi:MAG: TIGR03960 family B12-binding radical SAM protein [Nitrospirota bacterium]